MARTSTDGVPESTDVRWLDGLEMAAWLAYIETQGDLIAALDRDLAPAGLSLGDYQVFVHLSGAEDQSMRMSDLADALRLSASGLTRRLDGLVCDGLVERRHSDSDRRVVWAVLSPAGRQRLEAAAPIHLASVRRHLVDRLDRSDLEALARIFGAIQAGLDRDEA
ncbi:MAG TPA: MarR family transcriptional regulator [Ilumatobacter sp.]